MGSTLSKLDLKPPPTYLWTWTKYGQPRKQSELESIDSNSTEDFQIEYNQLIFKQLIVFHICTIYSIPWTMNGQNGPDTAIGQLQRSGLFTTLESIKAITS